MKFRTESAQRLEQEWNDPKLKAMVKEIVSIIEPVKIKEKNCEITGDYCQ